MSSTMTVHARDSYGFSMVDEKVTITVKAVPSVRFDFTPLCTWCDNYLEYEVVEDGWTHYACQSHRERYWTSGVSMVKTAKAPFVTQWMADGRIYQDHIRKGLYENDLNCLSAEFWRQSLGHKALVPSPSNMKLY